MLNDDFFVGASTQLLRVTPCLTAKLKDPWEPTGTGVCLLLTLRRGFIFSQVFPELNKISLM